MHEANSFFLPCWIDNREKIKIKILMVVLILIFIFQTGEWIVGKYNKAKQWFSKKREKVIIREAVQMENFNKIISYSVFSFKPSKGCSKFSP
jgi:hypothetical protein